MKIFKFLSSRVNDYVYLIFLSKSSKAPSVARSNAVCIIIVFESVYKLVVISCLTLTKNYEKNEINNVLLKKCSHDRPYCVVLKYS